LGKTEQQAEYGSLGKYMFSKRSTLFIVTDGSDLPTNAPGKVFYIQRALFMGF
jgi:hypothetical protein